MSGNLPSHGPAPTQQHWRRRSSDVVPYGSCATPQSCVIVASPRRMIRSKPSFSTRHDDLLDQGMRTIRFARGYWSPLAHAKAGARPSAPSLSSASRSPGLTAIRGHYAEGIELVLEAVAPLSSARSNAAPVSPATSRLSGSTASCCRRAYAVFENAPARPASSICRRFSASSRPGAPPRAASDALGRPSG